MGYHEDDMQAHLSWLDAKQNPDRYTCPVDGCEYDVEDMVYDPNPMPGVYVATENIEKYTFRFYPKDESDEVIKELKKQHGYRKP